MAHLVRDVMLFECEEILFPPRGTFNPDQLLGTCLRDERIACSKSMNGWIWWKEITLRTRYSTYLYSSHCVNFINMEDIDMSIDSMHHWMYVCVKLDRASFFNSLRKCIQVEMSEKVFSLETSNHPPWRYEVSNQWKMESQPGHIFSPLNHAYVEETLFFIRPHSLLSCTSLNLSCGGLTDWKVIRSTTISWTRT